MDYEAIARSIGQQFATVLQAPVPFLAAVLAAGWLIWLAVKREYATRLENAASTIALREAQLDDYKNKLSGATPDEARARIEALEGRVEALSPRALTPKQRQILADAAARAPGHMMIVNDVSCADAAPYLVDLSAVLRSAGWILRGGSVLGATISSPLGLSVAVPDPQQLSPSHAALVDALRAAEVPFTLLRRPHRIDVDLPDEVYTLVGAKGR